MFPLKQYSLTVYKTDEYHYAASVIPILCK